MSDIQLDGSPTNINQAKSCKSEYSSTTKNSAKTSTMQEVVSALVHMVFVFLLGRKFLWATLDSAGATLLSKPGSNLGSLWHFFFLIDSQSS